MLQLEIFLALGLIAQSDSIPDIELKSHESLVISDSEGETLQLGSVILGEDSELQLPKFKSVIIQKIIASDGARIRLASQNSGGDAGQGNSAKGGDGAQSRFFISHISGHILIEARGGDGADGRVGRNGKQGLDGEDGRRARTLFFGLVYLGGGEDGHQGETGEAGESGENGGDGGLGGIVDVYYQTKDPFSSVVVNADGGRAGLGGNAGLGGLGGNGGRGGKGLFEGRQGKMGARGVFGRPGRPGKPGEPGSAGVFQLEKPLFKCLMRLDIRSRAEKLTDADFNSCRVEKKSTNSVSLDESKVEIQSASDDDAKIEADDEGLFVISADGRDGVDAAAAFQAGSSPPSASSASSGGFITLIVRELPPHVSISAKGGRGGNGGDGIKGRDGKDGAIGRKPFVFKNATPGYPGTPGGDGEDGQVGGSGSHGATGGSGGKIKIVYLAEEPSENWHSHFDVSVSAGQGGKAGKAAEGGKGGLGGTGRTNGKNGLDAGPGIDGESGHSGNEGTAEFIHANSYVDWIVTEFQSHTK